MKTATPTERWKLTPKQIEVVTGIWRGWPDSLIGQELKCSVNTVRSHCGMIFQKMGCENRVQCALEWERHLTGNS